VEKDLKKKEETELVDFNQFTGLVSGFEGTDNDTFKMPFVKILQKLSPEVDPTDGAYVEGAEIGMFLNDATKELSKELQAIILKIEHNLIVWRPDRGGLVGVYSKSMENQIVAQKEGNYKYDAEGNDIVDTISFYLMNPEDPTDVFILSTSKASFKYGRSLATRVRSLKMNGRPVKKTWAGIWKIGLVLEENEKGKWYSIGNTPEFLQFVTADIINQAIVPALELMETAEIDFSQDSTVKHAEHDEDF
jgi:hypothetical protein